MRSLAYGSLIGCGFIMALTGCGTSGHLASASSLAKPAVAHHETLPAPLKNSYRYPAPVTKHFAATGASYLVPSPVGLTTWAKNPTTAILATLNRIRSARTFDQVMAEADTSYWSTIQHQWTLPDPGHTGYKQATEALGPSNVGSMGASSSPYASFIGHQFGQKILRHSWVLAVGQPGISFATWIKGHPALTPWFYFLDVRQHWLLYAVEN